MPQEQSSYQALRAICECINNPNIDISAECIRLGRCKMDTEASQALRGVSSLLKGDFPGSDPGGA